jgi:hypothetical protein
MLLLILISVTTTANQNDSILIKKGVPAPLNGAFVPEIRFKAMELDASLKDQFQRNLAICEESEMELQHAAELGQYKSFVVGAVAGAVLFWMARSVK